MPPARTSSNCHCRKHGPRGATMAHTSKGLGRNAKSGEGIHGWKKDAKGFESLPAIGPKLKAPHTLGGGQRPSVRGHIDTFLRKGMQTGRIIGIKTFPIPGRC